jgi:hypothetical protein
MSAEPRILRVGDEPPPMRPPERGPKGSTRDARPATKPKGHTGTRFKVINAFADFALADLSRAEIAVWLLLWRDTKADGLSRTSQADLARRAGVDISTIKRALRGLRRRALLSVVHAGGLRRGASVYRVNGTVRPLPCCSP